jgi:hypothetical protein
MWKPSKKLLFIISVILLTISGILYKKMNWDNIKLGENLFDELHQPTLFFCLGLYYMYSYYFKMKEEVKGHGGKN